MANTADSPAVSPAVSPTAARYVGQHIARKEDPRLLTGRGRYLDDHTYPGMLHAAFIRSPYARARIKGIDTAAARAVPGVHAVYTGADINGVVANPMRSMFYPPTVKFPRFMPLSDIDVRFAGDAVAIVLADDRYIAEDAAELVVVDYEPEDPVLDYMTAADKPLVHPEIGTNLVLEVASPAETKADVEAIFAKAAHVVEETIHQQRHLAMPMETRGLIAMFSALNDMTVHLSSQGPHLAAKYFAQVFDLAAHQVRVLAFDVGGGFGLKVHPNRDEIAIICAAKKCGRPVKWVEDRMEHLIASNSAREESAKVRFAFDKDGVIQAAAFDYMGDAGSYAWHPGPGPKAAEVFPGPYRISKYAFRARTYYTNTVGLGAYRGPWMFETVARECVMDVAAKQLGIDAVELRRRNLITKADQPYRTATGNSYDRISPDKCMEQVTGMLDVAAFRRQQVEARKQGRYLGMGLSVYMEPTANPMGMMATSVAEIRIEPSGHIVVLSNTHSQGQSTETTLAQIVADELGVDIADVRVLQGDTAQVGFGMGSGGSRQAVIGGGAATLAARELRHKVLTIAAHLMEAAKEDLTIENGQVFVKGIPQVSMTVKQVAETAYNAVTTLPAGMEPGLEARHRYAPTGITWTNAAHICIVDVDIDTGMVKVLRWLVSEDCGVMIHPGVVEGQVSGGVIQGIGGMLYEHACYDERGNPLAATMKDYLMPLATDVPVIEFGHVVTPSNTPGGFKGAGEGGAIIAPSTIRNAIANALSPFNIACNRFPLSPDYIVMALEEAKKKAA